MEWLNYHHLLYFWTVARTGSIAAASQELRLASPTISNQIRRLEDTLGERLFLREGRRLVLTDTGRLAMRYAEEIFSLGKEFTSTLREHPNGRPMRFHVGIADVLPKTIAYQLIRPALALPMPIHLICREGRPDHLLAELAIHELDLVLSDAPASPAAHVRASNHLLLESDVSFFVCKKWNALRRGFPRSLNDAPFLLPLDTTAARRDLEEWFHRRNLHPKIVGEFADLALLRVFALRELGVFAGPSVMTEQFRRDGFVTIGKARDIILRYFAISVERQVRHPAITAICNPEASQTRRKELPRQAK